MLKQYLNSNFLDCLNCCLTSLTRVKDTFLVELSPNQTLLALKQTNKNSQKQEQTESGTRSKLLFQFSSFLHFYWNKDCLKLNKK